MYENIKHLCPKLITIAIDNELKLRDLTFNFIIIKMIQKLLKNGIMYTPSG